MTPPPTATPRAPARRRRRGWTLATTALAVLVTVVVAPAAHAAPPAPGSPAASTTSSSTASGTASTSGSAAATWADLTRRPATSAWAGNRPNPYGGRDFYVDATRGDDAASGLSRAHAWRTLAKVSATTFQPGDRILLKGGETWAGQQLWPKGSGAPGKPITIDAYGSPQLPLPQVAADGKVPSPFLADGVTKNPDTVGLTGAVVLRNQEYWDIGHLQVSNDDDPNVDITTQRVVRDGISVSINADKLAPGQSSVMRGISIHDVFAHDIDGPSFWQKIYYAGIDFQIFGSQQWTAYPKGGYHFEDVRIERNTFDHVELNAIQFGFNWFGDAQGQADDSGRWHEGWEQLWVRTQGFYNENVYIGHNYAHSIGQGAYQFAGTQYLTAEYNEANGWLQRYDGVSAGLYLWAGADSTMRFNEVYDGPYDQYDATAWDLEYTNFDVTYEFNYSHDNLGGWMAYMGNSSNSVARYNLSVGDDGVILKNMLSVNYSPTYILNNVFVYDGAQLDSFHDAVLKSTVYFMNNVFYDTNPTATTTWSTQPGALDLGVFSNNAFYEASGRYSPEMPDDARKVVGDPKFVGDPTKPVTGLGVQRIRTEAAPFQLQADSPLIDQGRYNPRLGGADFFGTPVYFGKAPDIGIDEVRQGRRVINPIDTDPIEQQGGDTRTDLALGKPVVASSTHTGPGLEASNLTDGDLSTRWAAEDAPSYPLTIDIDLQAPTTFDEVDLREYTDTGTDPRIGAWSLQRWDDSTGAWVTFATGDGVGTDKAVTGFGPVTTSTVRLSIAGLLPGQTYGPTMREIGIYDS